MAYRTLEEKFLADYEALEADNARLADRVLELEAIIAKDRANITLDALVKAEGRKKVFDDAVRMWSVPDVGDRDFETWCHGYTYDHAVPQGVSIQEFVDYFADEYVMTYEDKLAKEARHDT